MEPIIDRIRRLISDELECAESTIRPESDFYADLGGDSLDLVWLITDAEDEFGILIPDEEAEGIRTPAQLAALVERKLAEDGGA